MCAFVIDSSPILLYIHRSIMSIKISLADHSQYFKGLLLLIRKDNRIHEKEKEFVMRIGKVLGFEKTFCENAIQEILENEFIVDEPPHFSSQEIAQCFIKDGIQLSLIDEHLDDTEIAWLSQTASLHNLDGAWLENELSVALLTSSTTDYPLAAAQFEIQ